MPMRSRWFIAGVTVGLVAGILQLPQIAFAKWGPDPIWFVKVFGGKL
jgi:hypothetical protein